MPADDDSCDDESIIAVVSKVQGFIEDYGIPRNLEDANAFIPQTDAESIALLDMRVFNMDRHPGNLLLLKKAKPHGLGPIDHGCCLPPWWCLGEAIFEAWIAWPQLQTTPSADACSLARTAYMKLPQTCKKLAEAELDASAVVTLRLCTTLVYIGVAEMGIPIGKLAATASNPSECWLQVAQGTQSP
ncbi:PI4KG4 [Symbiodinium pilosum]|uniref:PI4KG4 protein n=1 Tax=Symbiodinium pilosum TaxID=2952 RepID=A0A812NBD3_SYMPI|nr:PI4KG4 [Symbiodinium pilosum]